MKDEETADSEASGDEDKPVNKKRGLPKYTLYNMQFKKFQLPATIYAPSYPRGNGHLPKARYESDLDQLLFMVTKRQDLSALRGLVEYSKRNVDMRNAAGETPLIYAAREGALTSLRFLLGKNAKTDVFSDTGYTALHYAAKSGRTDIAEALLTKGANPNVVDANGETPLLMAAQYGFNDMVYALLRRGAEPNAVNVEGKTALDIATGNRVAEDLLIAYGAMPQVREGEVEVSPAERVQETSDIPQNVVYYDADGNEIKTTVR